MKTLLKIAKGDPFFRKLLIRKLSGVFTLPFNPGDILVGGYYTEGVTEVYFFKVMDASKEKVLLKEMNQKSVDGGWSVLPGIGSRGPSFWAEVEYKVKFPYVKQTSSGLGLWNGKPVSVDTNMRFEDVWKKL